MIWETADHTTNVPATDKFNLQVRPARAKATLIHTDLLTITINKSYRITIMPDSTARASVALVYTSSPPPQ